MLCSLFCIGWWHHVFPLIIINKWLSYLNFMRTYVFDLIFNWEYAIISLDYINKWNSINTSPITVPQWVINYCKEVITIPWEDECRGVFSFLWLWSKRDHVFQSLDCSILALKLRPEHVFSHISLLSACDTTQALLHNHQRNFPNKSYGRGFTHVMPAIWAHHRLPWVPN